MGTVKLVYCVWIDAFQFDEVRPVDYPFSVEPICTAGILVREDEKCLIISRDYFPNESDNKAIVRSTIAIPKKYIVKSETIKLIDEEEISNANL